MSARALADAGRKKPVHWVGDSRDAVRAMPEDVKDEIGKSLLAAQFGGRPRNAKALKGYIGSSVVEIVEDHDSDTYRCIYTTRFDEAVYVLHAFQKKSHHGVRTDQHDIALVRNRLREAEFHHSEVYGGKRR